MLAKTSMDSFAKVWSLPVTCSHLYLIGLIVYLWNILRAMSSSSTKLYPSLLAEQAKTKEYLLSLCHAPIKEQINKIQVLANEVNEICRDFYRGSKRIVQIHVIAEVIADGDVVTNNGGCEHHVLSVASAQFSMGLRPSTPSSNLLRTSLANTLNIANILYGVNNSPSTSYSLRKQTDDRTDGEASTCPVSEPSRRVIPAWIGENRSFSASPQFIRLSTRTIRTILSFAPIVVQDRYQKFFKDLNTIASSMCLSARSMYKNLSPPWLLANSVFLYGDDDRDYIAVSSDYLPTKRHTRGQGIRVCAAILCAFFQLEPTCRSLLRSVFENEIQECGDFF